MQTTVTIIHAHCSTPTIWIFQIPLLITKTPIFNATENLLELAPILTFKCPQAAESYFKIPDCWYYGPSDVTPLPFYLDVFDYDPISYAGRYRFDIASDFNNVALTQTHGPAKTSFTVLSLVR